VFKEIVFSAEVREKLRRDAKGANDIDSLIKKLSFATEVYRNYVFQSDHLRTDKATARQRLGNIEKHAKALKKALKPMIPRTTTYEDNEKIEFDGDSSHMLLAFYGADILKEGIEDDLKDYDDLRLLSKKLERLMRAARKAIDKHQPAPTPEWILRKNIYLAVMESLNRTAPEYSDTSMLVKITGLIYTNESIPHPKCFQDAYKPIVKLFKPLFS